MSLLVVAIAHSSCIKHAGHYHMFYIYSQATYREIHLYSHAIILFPLNEHFLTWDYVYV